MNTPIQRKIYEYIREYIRERGYSPSLEEIARGINLSPKSISLVSRHIHALVEAGQLEFYRKGYRNIQIVEEHPFLFPLLGRIAAGEPIEVIADGRETIDLRSLFTRDDHFMLQVLGNSMVDEGIHDGDLVICKHRKQAQEGDIVVALIDGQAATLKRISYKIAERITLIPANPDLKPKAYLPHRVQIQGIFAGLLRLGLAHK